MFDTQLKSAQMYPHRSTYPPGQLQTCHSMFSNAGRLDAELLAVTKRVTNVLQMLPKNITPVNLEELRRVKQQLVELESRAENIV